MSGSSTTSDASTGALARTIRPSGYFALAFGSIVGSGWILVLGEWLSAAGPGGTILGFAAGGAVMVLVACCYGELAGRMPHVGGEFLYALRGLGPRWAFAVSWFITLYFAAFTAFEGIALAWVVGTLLPGIRGPVLYSILGEQITLGGLALGVGGAMLFATMNYVGTTLAMAFQRVVTFGFIALAATLIACGMVLGDAANSSPLFGSASGTSWIAGTVWIFTTTAVFLNGFQSAAYAVEERRAGTPLSGVITPMILGVVIAILFYCGVVLAASRSAPWHDIIRADLPAAAAFGRLTDSGLFAQIVLIGAAVSLLKSWNAYVLSGARLLFAQSEHGFLPRAFSRVHARFRTPAVALITMLLLNLVGVALGRGFIVPILNMCAICLACSFVLSIVVLLKVRRQPGHYTGFQVPGGRGAIYVALALSTVMAATAAIEPWTHNAGAPPIEWILLTLWAGVGAMCWWLTRAYRRHQSGLHEP